MNNNAIINTRLEELFKILDPRLYLTIFKKTKDNKEELLRSTNLYRLLSDDEFIGKYGYYKVIGLTVVIGHTSLLIEEA
jgi:hypothetical protein